MKKRVIVLVVALVLFAGLLALYFAIVYNADQNKVQPAENPVIRIYDNNKTLAQSMQIKVKDQFEVNIEKYKMTEEEMNARPTDIGMPGEPDSAWVSLDYPMMRLLPIKVDTIVNAACRIFAEGILEEHPSDLSQYGLDGETDMVTVNYSDGTVTKLLIGDMSPDKMYNYVKDSERDTVYLLSSSAWYGMKLFYDICMDKTMSPPAHMDITELYIKERNNKHVVEAHRQPQDVNEYNEGYRITLTEPYPGLQLNLATFAEEIYGNLGAVEMGTLYDMEATPDEYGKYGFDSPRLEISFWQDEYRNLKVTLGNSAEDGQIYAMFDGYPFVFLTKEEPFRPFYNINLFKYMEKLVSNVVFEDVDNIRLTYKGKTYVLEPNFADKKPNSPVAGPLISGKSAPTDKFVDIFQGIIDFAYDIPIEEFTPHDNPEVIIEYNFLDPETARIVDKYYDYNETYYGVEKEGQDIQFAMRKQFIEVMVEKIEELQ